MAPPRFAVASDRPVGARESGFGYRETGATIVNVTNGKRIRRPVDDEPFDLRYGELLSHERSSNLRCGVRTR